MFFIGNRFKKSICLFLNPIVELLLFCLYMSVIPIKYVYTKCKYKTFFTNTELQLEMKGYTITITNLC